MEQCSNCEPIGDITPVNTGDCACIGGQGNPRRVTRLLAPTRHEASYWATNNPVPPEGVLAIVKDRLFTGSREYIIGDGEHTYTELIELYQIYAGAPLSRVGKANHSPLAASGKSTLDPSWLPIATSSDYGAVKISTTGAEGKVPVAGSNNKLDPSWLPEATSTTLGAVYTSEQGAAGKVPVAGSNGKLDPSWLPAITVDSADKLTNARTFLTDLESTTAAAFDGTQNNVHGITGVLPVSHGGTGSNNLANVRVGEAAMADEAGALATARKITVKINVDGVDYSDNENFDGSGPITLDLGNVTTGGGGSGSLGGMIITDLFSGSVQVMTTDPAGTCPYLTCVYDSGADVRKLMFTAPSTSGTYGVIVHGTWDTRGTGGEGGGEETISFAAYKENVSAGSTVEVASFTAGGSGGVVAIDIAVGELLKSV